MLLVDAQVHIWAADTPLRPWPANHGPPDMPAPFSKDQLLRRMDEAGVHRAVLVPPSWDGERNDVVLDTARIHPDRFTVMGRVALEQPGARAQLRTWRAQPGMSGVRLTFRKRPIVPTDWLWSEAEAAGVPLSLGVYGDFVAQFRCLDEIAARHPGLRIAVCHLGIQKGRKGAGAFADLDHVLVLARRPNVCVTATSLPSYASDEFPYRQTHSHLRRIYDAFGPRRIFWGTDLTRLPCSYALAIRMFTEELDWLTEEDKRWIMGKGISEWLGWDCSEDPAAARGPQ